MTRSLDPADLHARLIRDAPGGRELLRVASILARERPEVLPKFSDAVASLIRESVSRGWMHPDVQRELDETHRAN